MPVPEVLFSVRPDVMILTHDHQDHYDPETVCRFLTPRSDITVLAPESVWREVRKFGGANNFVRFCRHTVWTEGGIRFTAVKAEHSDPHAVGVILDDGEKKYYVTGDTLYNEEIFGDVPDSVYAIFLPVNGMGNNMNMTDGAEFCRRVAPRYAVPIHWGLLDDLDAKKFPYEAKVVPQIYKEVTFDESD